MLGAVTLKLVFHYYGWEFIELSALFTSLETMADEAEIIFMTRKAPEAREFTLALAGEPG